MGKTVFVLTDEENKAAHDFCTEHTKVCPYSFKNGNLPTTGEHYYFKIIPGGLGNSVEIGCIYCKDAHKDITDTSAW